MDVWQLIERDHDNIAQLIHDTPNALNGSGVIRSRERLLGDLIDQLETHAEAIDASLFIPLSRHPETQQLVEELRGEHRAFMRQLAGLARYRKKQSSGWLNAFGDASFLVDQYLHRHKHEMIPAARKILPREEIEYVTSMFIRGKMQALRSRQRGSLGGMALSNLAVTATVCAALGGIAFFALRSLQGRPEGRRSNGRGEGNTGRKGESLAQRQERMLDEAVEDTFPASDPISAQRFTK